MRIVQAVANALNYYAWFDQEDAWDELGVIWINLLFPLIHNTADGTTKRLPLYRCW